MGFKVIIIGGGLSGLGLAHCLDRAGIDFLVLERNQEICIADGASLALWPHNVRILDQLGLLEDAEKLDCRILYKQNVRSDGSVLAKNNMMESAGIRLGHPWMCFHRPGFLELLYKQLPNHETRVLGGKAFESMETTSEGVEVTCKDGSVYTGSIVVGADGVGSAVRKQMATKLNNSKLAEPWLTSYRGLFGWSSRREGIEDGTIYEMHGEKLTVQVIPADGKSMFLVYQRLPLELKGSTRYSDDEKEAMATEVGDIYVSETVQFKDLWAEQKWSFCSGLEEGTAEKWFDERTVLVGDTVHKMTPNVGLGLNSGWQSAAVLTNCLRKLLLENPEPSTTALEGAFQKYQGIRKKDASESVEMSGLYTRVVAWNNPVWRFVDQHVTKHIGGDVKLLDLLLIPMVKKGRTLDFLGEENFKSGTVAWTVPRTIAPKEVDDGLVKGSEIAVADVEVAA